MHIVICGNGHGPVANMIIRKLKSFTMTVYGPESITHQSQMPDDTDLLIYLHEGTVSLIPQWVYHFKRTKLIYSANSARWDEISETIDMIMMGKS